VRELKKFYAAFIFLLLVSSILFFPETGQAQRDMGYELSSINETYKHLDSLTVYGKPYQIISYQNDEVILLDNQGNLVLDTLTLQEVYKVKGFKDLFVQNGITTSQYTTIYSSLNTLYTNAKSVDDLMTWITIAAGILGVASIFVGGIAIPIATVVGAVKVATIFIKDNIQQPLNTAYNLHRKMGELIEDSVSQDYIEILSLSVQLREELDDLSNQLILKIDGFGNVAYYEALYKIADALEFLSSENANNLRNYAFDIEISQNNLETSLTWLKSLNTNSIIANADSKTNNYISLQNSRINSRITDFENELNNVNVQIFNAQANITYYASQGADISIPNSFITQANLKIELAENYASRHEYRTAKNYLMEASNLSDKAIETVLVSLLIHQAELKVSEAQSIINQKLSKGADVASAELKLNEATMLLQNSKSLLSTIPEDAKSLANDAMSYAEEARLAAETAVESSPGKTDQTTTQSEDTSSTALQLPQEIIYIIIILITIAIIIGAIVVIKKR